MFIKDKKIFLTGASGFIGMNLLRKLSLHNNSVFALVRNRNERFAEYVNTITGDISNPESYVSHFSNCDLVFHCAAHISFQSKDFKKTYSINVEGTRNVLEAAYEAKVNKVVSLSACAVLGYSRDKNRLLDEKSDQEIEKDNVYAYTKKMAELEVQKYVEKGLDVSIANIATVYGQEDLKLNSGSIIKSIYNGKMRLVPPGGTSFVSVDDLVDGLLLLAQKGKAGERYIFCTENMEYKELATRIANALGVKPPLFTMPGSSYYPALLLVKGFELLTGLKKQKINLITTQILKETYGYKFFNSDKAKKELGWQPVVSLEEAVKKAYDFYKAEKIF